MWQALGSLLPISVAIAFSSVPITAMILILLSPKRNVAALPFLAGWVIGIALVATIAALGAQFLPEPSRRHPQTATAVIEMLVGLGLVALAIVTRWRRPHPDETALPSWLRAVGSFGPLPAFGVALALDFRPKGLLLGIAAGLALYGAQLRLGETTLLIGVYTVLGSSTVVVPIAATLIDPRRLEPRLLQARDWLSKNGGIVTTLMLFMVGVVIFGDGLTRL
jgi:uncharacterized membrane protein